MLGTCQGSLKRVRILCTNLDPLQACQRATPIQRASVQRDKETVTEAECAPRVITLGGCCDAPGRARGRVPA